jgi:hypothetical protein
MYFRRGFGQVKKLITFKIVSSLSGIGIETKTPIEVSNIFRVGTKIGSNLKPNLMPTEARLNF